MRTLNLVPTNCRTANPLQLNLLITDSKNQQRARIEFEHSAHSYLRASQRGLEGDKISVALLFGEVFHKQGLIYYVLGEHNIPDILAKEKNKLANTIVVVAGDTNKIITCYRSRHPYKHIKMKSKILFKNYPNAA
jgi:hypothetical protein